MAISNKYQLLPRCVTYAENLIILATCDGASNVGQVGNEVARRLTKIFPNLVRMCCLSAVGAGSKIHIETFRKAKAVISINGCELACASNILRQKGIEPTFEVTVVKEGVNKIPTLDFDDETIAKISDRIVHNFLEKYLGHSK